MTQGFTVENWKLKLTGHPREDSFSLDRDSGIIAVADGVTRDPSKYLPNKKDLFGMLKFLWLYPNPSPAQLTAKIFTGIFPEVLRNYEEQNRDEKAVRKAVEEANHAINWWNQANIQTPDYLTSDLGGCVVAGASERRGIVSLVYLCDCGVAIFDKKGNIRFKTKDEGPNNEKNTNYWKNFLAERGGWGNPKARGEFRKTARNNPQQENSFGVLTGEKAAMHYLRTSTQELSDKEILIVYTDGLEQDVKQSF